MAAGEVAVTKLGNRAGIGMTSARTRELLKDLHTLTSDDVYTGAADLPIALNAG